MIIYDVNAQKTGVSAPWVQYYHSLRKLFAPDPDIRIAFNEDEKVITMVIYGQEKYDALKVLLPLQKNFGGVSLIIKLVPANLEKTDEICLNARLFDAAFHGNPNYEFTKVVDRDVASNPMTYVVFKKEVAQFFDDNLGDLYGNKNTLYENLAREVFNTPDGVFYSTDIVEPSCCDICDPPAFERNDID